MKKLVLIFTTVVALSVSQFATAQKTIVDAAVGNEDFSTLVAALKAADLSINDIDEVILVGGIFLER